MGGQQEGGSLEVLGHGEWVCGVVWMLCICEVLLLSPLHADLLAGLAHHQGSSRIVKERLRKRRRRKRDQGRG